MSVRTNWHLGDLDASPDDQFDIVNIADRVIDLGDPGELQAKLGRLVQKEARFWARGVRCDLKQGGERWSRPEGCYTCPHFERHTSDDQDLVQILCHLGRQQADLVERLERIRAQEAEEAASLAVAAGVTEAMEVAGLPEIAEAVELADALVA